MGFGSYDESEQDTQQLDTDGNDEEVVRTGTTEGGELRFEYGDASSDDLLEAFEEIRDE